MASNGESGQAVVVGVDGSDPSVAALSWASRYGAATGATVRAVRVWHYPTAAGLPPGKTPEPVEDEVEGWVRDELTQAVTKANPDSSAQVETKIVYGHPAQALIDRSRRLRRGDHRLDRHPLRQPRGLPGRGGPQLTGWPDWSRPRPWRSAADGAARWSRPPGRGAPRLSA